MKRFKFTPPNPNPKDWNLTFVQSDNWDTAKRRVLVFFQSVDSRDIKAGGMLADKTVSTAFYSAVEYAQGLADKHKSLSTPALTVANFQSYRHLHLSGHAKAEAEADFRSRALAIIAKCNPTHILFSGDLNLLYPMAHAGHKNGWVHRIDGRRVTSTLDFARLLEKDGNLANLLGFWCRHLSYLLIGDHPFTLKDLEVKPVAITSIKAFDKVMAKWYKAKEVAVDTEDRNLTVHHNKLYTIQLAFDDEPSVGYVIPVDHPHDDNPFTKDERKYIKKELRKAFGAMTGPLLLTMNGMFDLRVLRRQLKLDIIYLNVWEITAGEHDLDENISSLASIGIPSGGLASILCSYENDHYYRDTTGFSKEDRVNIALTSPLDEHFLLYGATDVVCLHGIKHQQLRRASFEVYRGKSYRDYFELHMLYQMGDTAHTLSHLRENGSMLDRAYLRKLLREDSVLSKALAELQDGFRLIPQVQEANQVLLDESGLKANSLFGSSVSQWTFSLTKSPHKAKLFFDVLGLKPVSTTPAGAPAVDKEFIAHYKDRNYIVALFGEFQEAIKLKSTYVKGWYRRLRQDIDSSTDDHMRADFGFFMVDTGRLASQNPNFQNIPTRGKLAKIIKEMFICPDGHILIRFDYSAHEVRGWSIVAKDVALASAFKAGQALRQDWIKHYTAEVDTELRKRGWSLPLTPEQEKELAGHKLAPAILKANSIVNDLKKKGDLHIQNVYRFFKKWVSKSDPLRDAIKSVVFG